MRFFYLTIFIITSIGNSLDCKSQEVFYQDIFHGGITGGGFSTGLGSGSGTIQINIELNSTIRKAFLFVQRFGNPKDTSITFQNNQYKLNHSNQVSPNVIFPNTPTFSAVHAIDITDHISPIQSNYDISIPNQNVNPAGVVYGNVYLFVAYENSSLNQTTFSILLNNFDMSEEWTNYYIENLNPININFPVGFSLYTDRLNSPLNTNDGSYLIINGINVGLTGGGSIGVDDAWNSGSRGHFYYQNNYLHGLSSSTADNLVAENDGLLDISQYLNNSETHLNWNLQWQSQSTYYNIYSGFFMSYTSSCNSFYVSSPKDTTICHGETLQMQATGGQNYEWLAISDSSAINDLSCTDCPNPTFSGVKSTTYTVRIWNTDSCSVVLPVRINVSKPEILDYFAGETKCGFSNGFIKLSNLPDNLDNWYVVSPNSDTLSQPIGDTYPYLEAGDYSVYYIDTFGCKSKDTIVTVESFINTTADFSVDPSTGTAPIQINLTNQSENATDYSWWINDVYKGNQLSGFFTDTSGTFEIELIAFRNDSICADTASFTLFIFDSLIVGLANVFTPNNDGANDFFNVKVNLPVSYKLSILNRWGNVVFEKEDQLAKGTHNLWNGETKNGEMVVEGTYFYKIAFGLDRESIDCELTDCEVVKQGFVQIIDN